MDSSRLIEEGRRATARDLAASQRFVEDWAMLYEAHAGLPRSAGRIYGYLLISEQPHHDQQELAEALGISQASVSSMTRRLMDAHLVERIGIAGSRRDHYRLREESWTSLADTLAQVAARFIEQIDRGLALPVPDAGPGRRHLAELKGIYTRLGHWLQSEAAPDTSSSA